MQPPEQQPGALDPQGSGAPAGFPTGAPDPRTMELFDKAVDYTRQMLAEASREVLAAMKLDPIEAAVKFGVRALRTVVQSAEQAGSPLPPEVVIAAAVQTVKDLAAAAEANGMLADGEEETFLREVMQQSIADYAKLDLDDGLINPDDLAKLQGGGQPAPGPMPAAPPPGGGGALAQAMQPGGGA